MHSDTTTWANGQITERCGELIETSHQTILALAKRFQIPIIDLAAAEPPRSTETYYLFGRYYRPEQATRDFDPVYQAVRKDLNAAEYPTAVQPVHASRIRLRPYQRVRMDRVARARRTPLEYGTTAGFGV